LQRSVDPIRLDKDIRLERKESRRGGSTGGQNIFLPHFPGATDTSPTLQSASFQSTAASEYGAKGTRFSPMGLSSNALHDVVSVSCTDFGGISSVATPHTGTIVKKKGRPKKSIEHQKPANEPGGMDAFERPFKSQKITSRHLPQSEWAYPKPRETSTVKKLELARSPAVVAPTPVTFDSSTPMGHDEVVVSTNNERAMTPVGGTLLPTSSGTSGDCVTMKRKRSALKESATITPSSLEFESAAKTKKKNLKKLPRTANGRFIKSTKTKSSGSFAGRSSGMVSRSDFGRAQYIESASTQATSSTEVTNDTFEFGTTKSTTPTLSSRMIASFLDSPSPRRMLSSTVSSRATATFDDSTSMTFGTPMTATTQLESHESLDRASGCHHSDSMANRTPLIDNQTTRFCVGFEGGGVVMHNVSSAGRSLAYSPIDETKNAKRHDEQPQPTMTRESTKANSLTPCSKFAANYTSSYDISPSSFMPSSSFEATSRRDLSPSTSMQLAEWLSSSGDREEVPSSAGGLSSSRLEDVSF
jgi:hypothetical protein